jgi:hypothetical protein
MSGGPCPHRPLPRLPDRSREDLPSDLPVRDAPAGRPRPPRRRVEQGRRDHGPLRPAGGRGHGGHVHRWGAGLDPQRRDGGPPARRAGPDRSAAARDGAGGRRAGRRPPLARLHGLGAARGGPAAAAAVGLLRPAAARARRRAPGPARAPVPPARDPDLRRERRLPAPGPHPDAQRLRRGVPRRRRPRAVPRPRRAVDPAEALLRPGLQPGALRGPARGPRGARPAVPVRGPDRDAAGERPGGPPPAGPPARDHHQGALPGHVRAAGRGAAQPPDPGGAGRDVLRRLRRAAVPGVAVGGLRVPTDLPEHDLFAGIVG